MNAEFRQILGSSIAFTLLVLHVYTMGTMIQIILNTCKDMSPCRTEIVPFPSQEVSYIATLVSGFVSALIIAHLACAIPGGAPHIIMKSKYSSQISRLKLGLVMVFFLVWIGVGFMSLLVGMLRYPNAISFVTEYGLMWLGLMASCGYAYFGITPDIIS